MKLYRLNPKLEIVELGTCDVARALEVLRECYGRGLRTYSAGEEAISETSFGLQRSEQDFIEVTCNGQNSVDVHSDRLLFDSRLSRVFSPKKRLRITGDLSTITEVVRDYAEMNREQFEQKYKDYVCR